MTAILTGAVEVASYLGIVSGMSDSREVEVTRRVRILVGKAKKASSHPNHVNVAVGLSCCLKASSSCSCSM